MFGVASMIGKILGGVALDRYSGKLVGALIILILVFKPTGLFAQKERIG